MLKLIIADDERMVRETLSRIIDWKQYNIELVGLCRNGLEAYDMILDESPDIVLTDLRMPGMDGLELIEKASETPSPPQFVILSGYGEFDYAKRAMKYGVKHYLLKPCGETQILESIRDVAKDCFQRSARQYQKESQFQTADSMAHNSMFSIINDTLYRHKPLEETFQDFEPFLDFYFTPYQLFYVYFLEEAALEDCLAQLRDYCQRQMPYVTVHGIYTRNTLTLFFKDCSQDYGPFIRFLSNMKLPRQNVRQEVETAAFGDLRSLLFVVLEKIRRYSVIYYVHSFHILSSYNYSYVSAETEHLLSEALNGGAQEMDRLVESIRAIGDLPFLKQVASSLLLKAALGDPEISAQWMTEFLLSVSREPSLDSLKEALIRFLGQLPRQAGAKSASSPMIQQIYDYVEQHIGSSSLTLKSIADQCLFMNTDYVSKKFQKETGMKFSAYLTSVRIRKAKEYLAADPSAKIQTVAAQVGCGNNPQYFSWLFRKETGMTPSAYVAKIHGRAEGT